MSIIGYWPFAVSVLPLLLTFGYIWLDARYYWTRADLDQNHWYALGDGFGPKGIRIFRVMWIVALLLGAGTWMYVSESDKYSLAETLGYFTVFLLLATITVPFRKKTQT